MTRVWYFSNKCPNGANIGETHANVCSKETSDDNVDRLVSILEIYNDADFLFEGFSMVTNGSTKSYLEATLTTLTQPDRNITSGRRSKDLHQQNRSIPMSYILLDKIRPQ